MQCREPDCTNSAISLTRGWCGTHYQRWLAYGTASTTSTLTLGEAAEYLGIDAALVWEYAYVKQLAVAHLPTVGGFSGDMRFSEDDLDEFTALQ